MNGRLRRYCVLPRYTLFPREVFRRDEEDRRRRPSPGGTGDRKVPRRALPSQRRSDEVSGGKDPRDGWSRSSIMRASRYGPPWRPVFGSGSRVQFPRRARRRGSLGHRRSLPQRDQSDREELDLAAFAREAGRARNEVFDPQRPDSVGLPACELASPEDGVDRVLGHARQALQEGRRAVRTDQRQPQLLGFRVIDLGPGLDRGDRARETGNGRGGRGRTRAIGMSTAGAEETAKLEAASRTAARMSTRGVTTPFRASVTGFPVERRTPITPAGVRSGRACRRSATAPATAGVEAEVPENETGEPPFVATFQKAPGPSSDRFDVELEKQTIPSGVTGWSGHRVVVQASSAHHDTRDRLSA